MADGITQNYSKKERAAVLVAEDELTDEEIAAAVGVTRKTIHNWKQLPEFADAVDEHVREIQSGMMRLAIAKKYKRVARLNEMEQRLWQIVEERASDYAAKAMEAIEDDAFSFDDNGESDGIARVERASPPGGSTGFITRTLKQIGAGSSAQLIEEFGVGTDVVRTIMSLHEQAAKELGQWSEKSDVNLGGSLKREYVIITEDVT